ncbi:unnamed protein product [Peronospora farinosa]|uniref:Uncharacterized protein n=1 Tax=Peronospora farinosa TaxID=134698 RepID=A0AAV0SUM8_9STRA|nr:unnamed protein product [Peronospora farinosa]CAI5708514.1 unnamed protein product [Peronospora farinosa]
MSARASRRGNTAAYGALPGAPISEIRTRKWTKEVATNPTEALQKGAFKKSKGRKRGAGEVGRMTRSVRQHLDAPLELLSEYPVRVHTSRYSSPARTTMALSAPASVPMSSPDTNLVAAASYPADQASGVSTVTIAAQGQIEQKQPEAALTAQQVTQPTHRVAATVVKAEAAITAPTTTAAPDLTLQMMPPVSNQLMVNVPSDEQLEMVLDDLPMLDADDSFDLDALDPSFLPTPVPRGTQATSGMHSSSADLKQQSAEDSLASLSEDNASGNSGSSMPSVSPQSSPRVMSRSSSP